MYRGMGIPFLLTLVVISGCGPTETPTSDASAPSPRGDSSPAPVAASGGAQLYARHCQGCHGDAGQGASGPAVAGEESAEVAEVVRNGKGTKMPAFGKTLSAQEIADLSSFVAAMKRAEGKGRESEDRDREKGEHGER